MIISFLPLLDIAAQPVAGFVGAGGDPGDPDGALGAARASCPGPWRRWSSAALVYYAMHLLGLGPGLGAEGRSRPSAVSGSSCRCRPATGSAWFAANWREAVGYLPVAIPLALATVVGGIDCTESAAAAGDDYPTGQIIAAEGLATLVGGLFGGVIQSTPYIGHPAYKAMGARAGYTLATALFVGGAGVFGYFDWIFYLIPKAGRLPDPDLRRPGDHRAVVPRDAAAALPGGRPGVRAGAGVPGLRSPLNQVLPETGKPFAAARRPRSQHWVETVTILSGGFIVTSLLWGDDPGPPDRRPGPRGRGDAWSWPAACRLVRRDPLAAPRRARSSPPAEAIAPAQGARAGSRPRRARPPTTGPPPTRPSRAALLVLGAFGQPPDARTDAERPDRRLSRPAAASSCRLADRHRSRV